MKYHNLIRQAETKKVFIALSIENLHEAPWNVGTLEYWAKIGIGLFLNLN